jgi:hypothetical protein
MATGEPVNLASGPLRVQAQVPEGVAEVLDLKPIEENKRGRNGKSPPPPRTGKSPRKGSGPGSKQGECIGPQICETVWTLDLAAVIRLCVCVKRADAPRTSYLALIPPGKSSVEV